MRKFLVIGAAIALMVGTFAVFAGPASADGTFTWGHQGFPNASCPTSGPGAIVVGDTMLWIFNDNGSAVPTSLTINGELQTGSWQQQGGGAYHFTATVDTANFPPVTASVTYTGTLGSNTVLTLSGCNESGPTTASLTIFKTIPNILQGNETATFTFQALVTPVTNPPVVAGSCTITFTAGQTSGQCTITGLQPSTTYTIHEVPVTGWDIQPDVTATTGAAGTNTAGPTFVNTSPPAHAQACKVTNVDTTGHDASTDTFTFDLKANGTTVVTKTVSGGGTAISPKCVSFGIDLVEGTTYTIVEETPATGWTQQSLVCDVNGIGPVSNFTPDYPADADAVFTCTATNSITAAHATVRKVTIPAGHEGGWTFDLKANGVTVETVTTSDATAVNFTTNLQDGVTYTVVEHTQAEWDPSAGAECTFTVHYPADSGRTFNCVFTNTHVSAGLTPGYWKNHLAANGTAGCSTLPSGTGCSKNGPFTKTYLPLNLGNYTVATIGQAANVFVGMNCSNSSGQNAVGCLAGQLLAAELNVANGASHCANTVISDANAFLVSIGYTGPSGTYTLTSAQRATAVQLASELSAYNAGTCPI
jgi:hypothetical protein